LSVKGLGEGRHKFGEVGKRVVRPRRGLGVVLHGEEGKLTMPNPLDGAVVQVEMSDLECGSSRYPERVSNYREAMVLGRDEHLAGTQIAHRMIPPAVAIGHLGRRAAIGEPHELVPESDSERRQAGAGKFADRFQRVPYGGGVSWSVGKKEAIGV
jgi:hypothetical protein